MSEGRHKELRKKLDCLNVMMRNDGAQLVTEVLKYLMDCVDPKNYGWKAKDHE